MVNCEVPERQTERGEEETEAGHKGSAGPAIPPLCTQSCLRSFVRITLPGKPRFAKAKHCSLDHGDPHYTSVQFDAVLEMYALSTSHLIAGILADIEAAAI